MLKFGPAGPGRGRASSTPSVTRAVSTTSMPLPAFWRSVCQVGMEGRVNSSRDNVAKQTAWKGRATDVRGTASSAVAPWRPSPTVAVCRLRMAGPLSVSLLRSTSVLWRKSLQCLSPLRVQPLPGQLPAPGPAAILLTSPLTSDCSVDGSSSSSAAAGLRQASGCLARRLVLLSWLHRLATGCRALLLVYSHHMLRK